LRPHARGGLGEVFVARDEEVHREVALKEISASHADDPLSRSRFLREAEITGRLEHPGIVPVYGLGAHPDGRPFYAMRFIQGDSLKDAIARFHEADVRQRNPGERALALRELLGRFVVVCNAVAYAHSRGVLHRDLKPANVMLGPYGETLVVDWGLAKVLSSEGGEAAPEGALQLMSGDGSSATQVGAVIGTPAYMSPEQAEGRLAELGPASDVYSLGATLYCLLTGQPPFDGREMPAVLLKVVDGEFPALRQVKREVPAALEAVCLKAMASRPEDRYPTASALAADVEKWLADEPTSAWREPWRVRAGRWARRNQATVAACVAGLLVAVLAGGAGAWWLGRQWDERRQGIATQLTEVSRLQGEGRWREARLLLKEAKSQLVGGRPHDLAERLSRAEAELDLVERLERIRLKAAILVDGRFRDRAGVNRSYEKAFQEAGMGEVGGDAEEVAAWLAGTAVREALVAALADWADAAEESQRAWLLEVARRADPDPWRNRVRDPEAWDDPAELARRTAGAQAADQSPQLLAVLGTRLEGKDQIKLLKGAWERHPGDFWISFALGDALQEMKKPAEAEGYYRAALGARPGTAAVYHNLGFALRDQRRLDEAAAELHKAIDLDSSDAALHHALGLVLLDQGKRNEAIAESRKAIELDDKSAHPHNALGVALHELGKRDEAIAEYYKAIEIKPDFAFAYNNLGNVLDDQGKRDEAIAAYKKAIAINPWDVSYHFNLGTVLYKQGKYDEALAALQRALERDPRRATSHQSLGLVLEAQGKRNEAMAEFRKAIALDPDYANPHNGLGNVFKDQGKLVEAAAEYRTAIEIDPTFAFPHCNLGTVLSAQGKLDEAAAEYRKAIDLDPGDPDYHYNLALVLSRQGKSDQAIAAYRKALPLWPARHPLRKQAAQQLQQLLQRPALEAKLAAILRGEGRPDDAVEQMILALLAHSKKQYATAARFYTEAFAAQPSLAEQLPARHRYNAACSAALAAAGQGQDAGKLDDKERTRLRRQVLAWLRADLALWARQAGRSTKQERTTVQEVLSHWKADADLAGVRDRAAVENLPAGERLEWKKLWADVEAVVK
jgi:tetratricopeptide (TPR) repeat protein/tRNA A-37 threonylcarbamoyl transferase component Bud32